MIIIWQDITPPPACPIDIRSPHKRQESCCQADEFGRVHQVIA
ncbi:hypothetical protein CTS44_05021 [Comamonas thiooxydans]|nr:hypothetical protein CTS44_05021 [Comamonas thiooxydans]